MSKLPIFTLILTLFLSTSLQDHFSPLNPNWDSIKEFIDEWDDAEHFSPQPFVNLGGKFYYFEPTLNANWYAAFEFCRRLNMFLVTVETKQENDLIIDYISQIGVGTYWTSGSDLAKRNEYIWSATGERVGFTDWHKGQPDHAGDLEFSINFWFVNNATKWNDGNPNVALHFICEQP